MKHRKGIKIFLLLLLLLILLVACEQSVDTTKGGEQNPLKAMADSQEQYTLAAPDIPISFPRAHFPHKAYRHEWWYLTANLTTSSGQRFATQWTLFRIGMNKRHWYFAHAALADTIEHLAEFRQGREELGNVGFTTSPFSASIDDWSWQSTAELLPAQLSYGTPRYTEGEQIESWQVKLSLSGTPPYYLQGVEGFSQKHSVEKIASHYYSHPFIDVQGDIYWQGQWQSVTGKAWFDREWGSQMLAQDQQGWDWFSLRLTQDLALMIYRIRSDQDDFLYGSLMHRDGIIETLSARDIALQSLESEGVIYPEGFRLKVAPHGIDLNVAVINNKQIMRFGIEYFEGMVSFTGSHAGEGFVEMTGYSRSK